MATIAQHDSAIRNLLERATSDDTKISPPLMYQFMKAARAFLVYRKLNNFRAMSESNYQTVCLPLTASPFYDCSCVTSSDCLVMKSDCSLPEIMTGRNRSIINVTTLSGKPIQYVHPKKLHAKTQSGLQKEYYTIFDNNVYVFNSELRVVLVSAVFADPNSVNNFCNCNSTGVTPCPDKSTDSFPIDEELVQPMYDEVFKRLSVTLDIRDDERNDASNEQG